MCRGSFYTVNDRSCRVMGRRGEGLTRIFTDGTDFDGTDFWIAVVLLLLLLLLLVGRVCAEGLEEAVGLFFGEFFFFATLFLLFFVVDVIEVVGFEGGAWFCQVQAFGGGFDGADDVGREGFGVEAAGVVAGELEAVEESSGSLDVELSGGEGVDDDGEGDLDGFAVFEGGEFDVLAGDEVAAGGRSGAEGAVALVEAVVEVAPCSVGEGWGLAAGSVGLDVAAEGVLHRSFSCFIGGTPLLPACKCNGCRKIAGVMYAKFVQPNELRPNSRQ